jgi:uncharacterized membrane protein YgcG
MMLPAFGFSQGPESLVHSSTSYVDDFANVFTPEQRSELDAMIRTFHDTAQFSLVTVNTLNGMDPAEFAVRLGNHWGVGSKSNNGVLILVCPAERKFFTATGGGVQGDLTDDLCSRYFNVYAKSRFKENDYFGGCKEVLAQYINRLSPSTKELRKAQEIAVAEQARKDADRIVTFLMYLIPIVVIIALVLFFVRKAMIADEERKSQWAKDKHKYDTAFDQLTYVIDLAKKHNKCVDAIKLRTLIQDNGIDKLNRITNMISHEKMMDQITNLNSLVKLTEPLRRTVENYSNSIDTARSTVIKWSKNFISKIDSEIQNVETGLANRTIDTTDHSQTVAKAKSTVLAIVKEVDYLKSLIGTQVHQSDLTSQINRVQRLDSELTNLIQRMESVIDNDSRNKKTATNARSIAESKISEYEQYSTKHGVSTESAVKTKTAAVTLRKRLGEIDNMSLVERLAWLAAFVALVSSMSNPSKTESESYDAEQRRIAADTARRKKRQQEEDEAAERRRRSSSSSSYLSSYSSVSSYSSSDSGSSSSSSISSSSFGGGSFDGGGGGGSW